MHWLSVEMKLSAYIAVIFNQVFGLLGLSFDGTGMGGGSHDGGGIGIGF